MRDVERGEVVADHRHHGVDGALAHDRQPFRLGLVLELCAIFTRQALADGLQIVAGIEALGDRADVFAQSLAGSAGRRSAPTRRPGRRRR